MPNFTIGDIVTVRGYGGCALVVNMEEDGVTPQGHPKYLCTVDFGPYDDTVGYALKNNPRGKYSGVGQTLKQKQGRLHQFYAGRLKNIFEDAEEQHGIGKSTREPKVTSAAAQAARQAELKAIEIEMALLKAELSE